MSCFKQSFLFMLQSVEPGHEHELRGLRKEDCLRMAENVDSITPRDKETYTIANELLDIRYWIDSKGIKCDWSKEIAPLICKRIEDCYARIEQGDGESPSEDSSDEYNEEDMVRQMQEEKEVRRLVNLKKKQRRERLKALMPRKRGRPKGSKNKIRY